MRALYTAATGMTAQQLRIDNIANNLANVGTTGFKKQRESFEDLVYQTMVAGGADGKEGRPAEVQIGTGTRLSANSRDFRPGNLVQTGEPLDLAIRGRGFFVVETEGGEERYTRDGGFTRDADGEVVNSAGMPLASSLRLPDDAEEVVISDDGTVQVRYSGETEYLTVGTVQIVDFVNPAGLEAVGGNLFSATPASGEPVILDPAEGQAGVAQGYLEASNVDVAEELINMVLAQRSFELTSKAVQASDEALQVVANLKR